MEPKSINYQAEVIYDGETEFIKFSVIGNSPDLFNDAKQRYAIIRKGRSQNYDSRKCKVVSVNPL